MIFKCDFCSIEHEEAALYTYRTISFVVLPRLPGLTCTSEGDWAACAVCHEMIEHDKWDELAERCVEILDPKGSLPHNRLKAEFKELHRQFREARL